MMETGAPDMTLAAARFVHFGAAMLLFGAALFPFHAGGAHRPPPRLLASLAFISALAWAASLVLKVAGNFSTDALAAVFLDTGFGRAWLAHLGLGAVLVALASARVLRPWLTLAVAALHLATLAGVGHAARDEGALSLLHLATHALHLLAAGAWLGALAPLAARLGEGDIEAARRFSRVGYVAAVLVLVTGLGNLRLVTGEPTPDLATLYGRLAGAKLGVFALLLGLAAFNRLYASPRGRNALLRRTIVLEQAAMAALLALAALLGMSAPGA